MKETFDKIIDERIKQDEAKTSNKMLSKMIDDVLEIRKEIRKIENKKAESLLDEISYLIIDISISLNDFYNNSYYKMSDLEKQTHFKDKLKEMFFDTSSVLEIVEEIEDKELEGKIKNVEDEITDLNIKLLKTNH